MKLVTLALLAILAVGFAVKANAYSCSTSCYTVGGYQHCNTYCY